MVPRRLPMPPSPRVGVAMLLLATMASTAAAQWPYTLNIHFTRPTYSACNFPAVSDDSLSCAGVTTQAVAGHEPDPSFAWILVGDVPPHVPGVGGGIQGVQFGLTYPPPVILGNWTLCTGGAEIPQDDAEGTWPESGSGNAVTWSGGCYDVVANPDGLTRVGFFFIDPGSAEEIRIDCDPRIDRVRAADCLSQIHDLCREKWGRGDTNPDGPGGLNTCGIVWCPHADGPASQYPCLDPIPVREQTWGRIKALHYPERWPPQK